LKSEVNFIYCHLTLANDLTPRSINFYLTNPSILYNTSAQPITDLNMVKINGPFQYIPVISMIIILLISQSVIASQNRVALVIGNGNYQNAPLKNPVNDAQLVAKNLKKLGFKVILKINASQQGMDEAITTFGQQLKQDDVGLFFYAGHGIQSRGNNYLIPVDEYNLDI
jgi:hypothetical protein